jgi:hypothetical protein
LWRSWHNSRPGFHAGVTVLSRSTPAKRFVDIEMALRWAYRDQLPKRGGAANPRHVLNERVWSPYMFPAGYSGTSPMFREAVGGGPSEGYADGWTRDPGFPPVLGAPHPDALAIEETVIGLAAYAGHSFGADDTAGLMHGFDLPSWRGHLDFVQAGMEAIASMAGIIAVHARAGTRPRWTRELPEPLPVTGSNGKPQVLVEELFVQRVDRRGRVRYEPADEAAPGTICYREPVPSPPMRKDRYRSGTYCPLAYRPAPASIVGERAEYAAWRMGLELLYERLSGRLCLIAPLPPSAPWRPWAGEGEAHGRPPELFRGLREEPYRKETREQAAARRRAARRRAGSEIRAEETRPVRPPPRRNGDAA